LDLGCVISPDGTILATASNDRSVRLWDIATGRELRRMLHDSDAMAVAFAEHGKTLLSCSFDRTARL
jgi:WD40 repeat protein